MITIEIPILTRSPANGSRGHWSTEARRRRVYRSAMRGCLLYHAKPALPLVVTFTRVSPCLLDDDNNVASFKSMRDEVASWLGVDDDPKETRISWRYTQEHSRKSKSYPAAKLSRITIESIAESIERIRTGMALGPLGGAAAFKEAAELAVFFDAGIAKASKG